MVGSKMLELWGLAGVGHTEARGGGVIGCMRGVSLVIDK